MELFDSFFEIFIHIYSQTACEARLIETQNILKEVEATLMALADCRDNPCQNGNCIDLENDYRCDCQSFYSGKNCDINCPVDHKGGSYREVDGVCIL